MGGSPRGCGWMDLLEGLPVEREDLRRRLSLKAQRAVFKFNL